MNNPELVERKKKMILALQKIDSFCETNGIKYFVMYGSLIGAVRHKGIIPWDDDIDIAMLRDDYEKFLRFCPIIDRDIEVREQALDNTFPYYYAKVIVSGTHLFEYIDGKKYDVGIGIDLFPLDDVPDDETRRRKMLIKVKTIRNKMLPHIIDRTKKRVWYKQLLLFFMGVLFPKKAYQYVAELKRRVFEYRQPESKCVTEIMTPYGEKAILARELFDEIKRVPFEDIMVNIPKEYDAILTRIYGDYMTLPPKEDQITHHKVYSD